LPDLTFVGEDGRELVRDVELERDAVLLELPPYEVRAFLGDGSHVLGFEIERLLPSEGQVLLTEARKPLHFPTDRAKQRLGFGLRFARAGARRAAVPEHVELLFE
jgi:hypothetical protein